MNRKQRKRLLSILAMLTLVVLAAALILYALKQNINLFYTPSQLAAHPPTATQTVRVGGYVANHSVHFSDAGSDVSFIITDHQKNISVDYHGVLPNLFREGQGIVVTGHLSQTNLFVADQVLAKHDEKYMPWPIAEELKKQNGDNHAA